MIAAMDKNNLIGKDNQLPFHIPEDLKRFKELTLGYPVIMGRKTFDSLNNVALPDRLNIVATNNINYNPSNNKDKKPYLVTTDLKTTINSIKEIYNKCFVIGGSEIYKYMLPYTDEILITRVNTEIEGDGVYFPEIDLANFKLVLSKPLTYSAYICDLLTYVRKNKK
jgi:dihydrofolate reductase